MARSTVCPTEKPYKVHLRTISQGEGKRRNRLNNWLLTSMHFWAWYGEHGTQRTLQQSPWKVMGAIGVRCQVAGGEILSSLCLHEVGHSQWVCFVALEGSEPSSDDMPDLEGN